MAFKILNLSPPDLGSSVQYGADDLDVLNKIFSGEDLSATNSVFITTTTKYADQKFKIADPSTTRSVIFKTTSGMSTDRKAIFPALSADDSILFANQTQTVTGKTIDYNQNTLLNLPTLPGGSANLHIAQTWDAIQTFLDGDFALRNPANTFSATIKAGTQTANQTFTFPVATSDTILTAAATQTVSGKSISGSTNTLTNIPKSALPTTTLYNDVDNSIGAHYVTFTGMVAPGNPATGDLRLYTDSADNHLKIKHPTGTITDLDVAGGGSSGIVQFGNYIVYIDGAGRVNALNGLTGVIDYSTASAPATPTQTTSLFNSLFTTALGTTGGLILLKSGTYTVNGLLAVGLSDHSHREVIIGMWAGNRETTIVKMDSAASLSNIFKCYCGIDFRNFTIDSNTKGQHLIDQQEGYYTNIENIHFKPGPEIGLFTGGTNIRGLRVAHCYFDVTTSGFDQATMTASGSNVEYMIYEGNYFNKLTGNLGGSSLTSAAMRNAIIKDNVIDRDPTDANQIFGISLENFGNNYQDVVIKNNIVNHGIIELGGSSPGGVTWKNILIEGNTLRGGSIRLDDNTGSTACLITGVSVVNNKFVNSSNEAFRYATTGNNVLRGNTFLEWNVNGSDPNVGFASAITTQGTTPNNLEVVDNTFIQTLTGTNQSAWAIRHVNDSNWSIHQNKFIKTNSGNGINNAVGTQVNCRIYDNEGYVTTADGVTQFSGDNSTTAFNVTHGLGGGGQTVTPAQVIVTTNLNNTARVSAISSTTFTVTFASAPSTGTNNITVYWRASKVVFP